jgi:Glu-tRNA(Gln) amidotransferase subunit E-like FAD-binding protein
MKSVIFVSKSEIAVKIFRLALIKEELELTIVDSVDKIEYCDLIVLDEDFISNDLSSIKRYATKVGMVTSNKEIQLLENFFLIPRPFLPSTLKTLIKDNIKGLSYEDQLEEFDASIIDLNSLEELGGQLDKDELESIEEKIKKDHTEEEVVVSTSLKEDPIVEIDNLIEDIINEIEQDTSKHNDKVITLNKYTMEQLKPLFGIIDQDIIDKLSNGESVNLKLKLKD